MLDLDFAIEELMECNRFVRVGAGFVALKPEAVFEDVLPRLFDTMLLQNRADCFANDAITLLFTVEKCTFLFRAFEVAGKFDNNAVNVFVAIEEFIDQASQCKKDVGHSRISYCKDLGGEDCVRWDTVENLGG